MKECRYCKKLIEDKDIVCHFCGYDHKTDTISQTFTPTAKDAKKYSRSREKKGGARVMGVSPRVRNFAFIGLALVIFSIFYKYNFNVNAVLSEVTFTFTRLRTGQLFKGRFGKKKDKDNQPIEWLSIQSFEGADKSVRYKGLVLEGILFDSNGNSFATINGKVFTEGDTIDNITVKRINKDSVEVIVGGQKKFIELKQE